MHPDVFGTMRPYEYKAVVEAFTEAENNRLMYLGEIARGATLKIVGPFLKRKVKDIRKWWPFPWDESEKIEKRLEKATTAQKRAAAKALLERIGMNEDKQE